MMSVQSSPTLLEIYRKKAGMTKTELGKRAKVTPKLITIIEEGDDPNPLRRTMINLSDALGVPPSVLFFPEQEIRKRQMITNMVTLCMEALNATEEEVYRRLANMQQFSTHSDHESSETPQSGA